MKNLDQKPQKLSKLFWMFQTKEHFLIWIAFLLLMFMINDMGVRFVAYLSSLLLNSQFAILWIPLYLIVLWLNFKLWKRKLISLWRFLFRSNRE